MEKIIAIDHLSKSFGDIKAVDDLSFEVRKGELFAFLGVNGAGKSTTISMMCGQLRPDGGNITIADVDVLKNVDCIKDNLGVVFQNSVLDKQLTVNDNLKTRASLYGIRGADYKKRIDELDELLSVKELLKRPVGKLSGGQRRRIDIARAILHKPGILILDEPTTGLDPQTRKAVWNAVNSLRKNDDMTVFLTTHYMEEAVDADYIVILNSGRIAAKGTPLQLKNAYIGDFLTLYGITKEQAESLSYPVTPVRDGYRLAIPDTKTATGLILEHSELFNEYEITMGQMDDVFLAVTGIRLEGGEDRA